VPAFVAEATNQDMLKMAGIHHKNCFAIISLFEDDIKNSQIATISKLLNKNLDVIVKGTSKQHIQHYEHMGLKHIQNPFEIVSERIYYGITSPHIWLLEMWVYGHILKLRDRDRFPKGKYIVCGYGRMGQAITNGLNKAGVEYVLYPIDSQEYKKSKQSTIFGDDEDIEKLLELGVMHSNCIIAVTKNDLLNLSILNQAKNLNPDIFTIARENSLDDITIFKASKVNKAYIVEEILANTTYNYLARPLAYIFINEVRKKSEKWGKTIVKMMNYITGMNPLYFEITINNRDAYALSEALRRDDKITLADLRRSRSDNTKRLNIVYLLLKREDEIFLLPHSSMKLKLDDELLISSNEDAQEDFEYIINNIYELNYVLENRNKIDRT
ncbi:MAG: NAD-binding protein, partial [Campylobacterota bacterium]|nr:NAD-binding protein [Campylobacterota bacterium]